MCTQELIQNADDAGAKVVRFYIDNRQHKISSFINERFAKYPGMHGPALIAANDAVFTDKDWEGIQRLQDSIKADDPFNVGKYGIGFNSVYHITGVCNAMAVAKKFYAIHTYLIFDSRVPIHVIYYNTGQCAVVVDYLHNLLILYIIGHFSPTGITSLSYSNHCPSFGRPLMH